MAANKSSRNGDVTSPSSRSFTTLNGGLEVVRVGVGKVHVYSKSNETPKSSRVSGFNIPQIVNSVVTKESREVHK